MSAVQYHTRELILQDEIGDQIRFKVPGEDGDLMSAHPGSTTYVRLTDDDVEALEAFCHAALNRARDDE